MLEWENKATLTLMSEIIFDCLVLEAETEQLREAFAAELEKYEEQGRIAEAAISLTPNGSNKTLEEQWESENPDEPLGDRSVYRYVLTFERKSGSINELAMDLAELLTPKEDLPPDPVQREFDELLLGVATYPWAVVVRP